MAGLREWIEERRTEGIGAMPSLLLIAAAMGGIGYLLWRGSSELPSGRFGPPEVKAAAQRDSADTTLLMDHVGRRGSLADFRGKVVLVDVWASWCPPCRRSLPEIAALQTASEKAGDAAEFVVVPVSVDQGGMEDVRKFLVANPQLNLKAYVPGPERESLDPLGPIRSIPATFVLDREGRIRQRWTGFIPSYAATAVKNAVAER